jgi:hypothetical protein
MKRLTREARIQGNRCHDIFPFPFPFFGQF